MKVWRYFPPFISRTKRDGSDHFAVLETFRRTVEEASTFVSTFLEQGIFHRVKGSLLDIWGRAFGIGREVGEDDQSFRSRIQFELTAIRQTKAGLKRTALFYSPNLRDQDIEIFEPFSQLSGTSVNFRTSVSRTPDHRYWGWGIIDIRTTKQISSLGQQKIEDAKAAGIRIFYSVVIHDTPRSSFTTATSAQTLSFSVSSHHTHRPLRTSVDGGTSLFGITYTGTKQDLTITLHTTHIIGAGDVPGYGKGPWGKFPYGSFLPKTSEIAIGLTLTNTQELYDFENGYGIGMYGIVPYGTPFAHFHPETVAFAIITQEG